MNRQRQMWTLALLSALTAVCQYAVQGALAMGETSAALPGWFKATEVALWGLRAFVEVGCVAYLFQTATDDPTSGRLLAILETALVSLIALTLGPALWATGRGVPMQEIGEPAFTLWNFGLAAYAPLMIGGVGFAYKVQPGAETGRADAIELQALVEQVVSADFVSKTARAQFVAMFSNGNRPPADALADELGCDASTVSRAYSSVE